MIVDNSIVVLENIFHYRSDGYNRWDSCVLGTKEVVLSVTASTLTTVAVFLPIGLSGGMTGMIFREFCITIVALLSSSLIISLTLVPLLCYILLDRGGVHQISASDPGVKERMIADKPLMRWYKKTLKQFITHRWIGIVVTVVICVVSAASIALAGQRAAARDG